MHNSILIIDDEPTITAALMIRLEAKGYLVYHVINGLAGMEAAQMHQPDVIVLDVRMPDLDGFEVCRKLKLDSQLADIPVVFLSGDVEDSVRLKAFEIGAAAYLSKPCEAADIIQAIEHSLEKSAAQTGAGQGKEYSS